MEAPESTPTFNAPDADAIGKVKDVALDKAQDLFAQGKAKLDKVRHLDIHDASACLACLNALSRKKRADPTADAPLASNSQVVRFGGNPTMNIELRKVRPNPPCFRRARPRGPIAAYVESVSGRATRKNNSARGERNTREKWLTTLSLFLSPSHSISTSASPWRPPSA